METTKTLAQGTETVKALRREVALIARSRTAQDRRRRLPNTKISATVRRPPPPPPLGDVFSNFRPKLPLESSAISASAVSSSEVDPSASAPDGVVIPPSDATEQTELTSSGEPALSSTPLKRIDRPSMSPDYIALQTPQDALDAALLRAAKADEIEEGPEECVAPGNDDEQVASKKFEVPSVDVLVTFLKGVPQFQMLTEPQLINLARSLGVAEFKRGSKIIEEGHAGDMFFVLLKGEVVVKKKHKGVETVLSKYSSGSYFGERSLLTDEPRAATIVALGGVVCLTLHRKTFSDLLSNVNNLLEGHTFSSTDDCITTSELVRDWSQSNLALYVLEYQELLEHWRKLRDELDDAEVPSVTNDIRTTKALLKLTGAFTPELGADDVIRRIMQVARVACTADRVGLFLVDRENSSLILKQAVSSDRQMRHGTSLPIAGLAGHVAQTGEVLRVDDAYENSRFDPEMDRKTNYKTRTMLCVPIFERSLHEEDRGEVIAVVEVINKQSNHRTTLFTKQDEDLVTSIAQHVGAVLLARRDELEHKDGLHFIPSHELSPERTVSINVRSASSVRCPGATGLPRVCAKLVYGGLELASAWCDQPDRCERHSFYDAHIAHDKIRGKTRSSNLRSVDYSWSEGKLDFMGTNAGVGNKRRRHPQQMRDVPQGAIVVFELHWSDGPSLAHKGKDARRFSLSEKDMVWGACTWADFKRHVRQGKFSIPLRPVATNKSALLFGLSSDVAKHDARGLLVVEFEAPVTPVIYIDRETPLDREAALAHAAAVRKVDAPLPRSLAEIIAKDALYVLTEAQVKLVWNERLRLLPYGSALPVFVQAVDWTNCDCVSEAVQLLRFWEMPSPGMALRLLGQSTANARFRAYAVHCLESLNDAELRDYMLQLSQALKFEPFHDSALARFLLRRALRNTRVIGHVFFWSLRSELHIKAISNRFGVLLEQYLNNCGDHRLALGHQLFVERRLVMISQNVSQIKSRPERTKMLRKLLQEVVLPGRFQLPVNPDLECCGIIFNKCKVMDSKKMPLWLVFRRTNTEETVQVMFKVGDDLRQDQLTLQVLRVMDRLWHQAGLDMHMSCYRVVPTGNETGFLEIVGHAETLASIVVQSVEAEHEAETSTKGHSFKRRVANLGQSNNTQYLPTSEKSLKKGHLTAAAMKLKAMRAVANKGIFKAWLEENCSQRNVSFVQAQSNFMYSCAGYCIATYVLGIGDRHNDNIMLKKDGHFFHIDFGHFLGHWKSKFGIRRERVPFVFTPALCGVIGSEGGEQYTEFVQLCTAALNTIRHEMDLIVTLFELMVSCGIPELQCRRDISFLRETLMVRSTDSEASAKFTRLLSKCMRATSTQVNDAAHIAKHYSPK